MLEEKKVGSKPFAFKQFKIAQDNCAMKVGTDGVLLGAWANIDNTASVLDIGTGTGIIAIMVAQRLVNTVTTDIDKNPSVHAVEIEEQAYFQAKENMANSPFASQLTIYLDSIQNYAKSTDTKYDLIISNPPFFTGGTFSSNQDKTNVRHTVKLPHGDLLNATRQLMDKDGKFCVILPLIEGLRFIEIARTYGFYLTKQTEVYPFTGRHIERLLLQFELQNIPIEKDHLIIQQSEERNDYTQAYKDLTKDFYTIF
jgi:tRNA1Val (adenine37-N6)-methyltransferase